MELGPPGLAYQINPLVFFPFSFGKEVSLQSGPLPGGAHNSTYRGEISPVTYLFSAIYRGYGSTYHTTIRGPPCMAEPRPKPLYPPEVIFSSSRQQLPPQRIPHRWRNLGEKTKEKTKEKSNLHRPGRHTLFFVTINYHIIHVLFVWF